MARRVFISYQHQDQMRAKGFHLLRWSKNVALTFVGRHLLDPVKSNNRDYIRAKIKEQLKGTSATVVLIGRQTHQSSWVSDEIRWSLEKGNGVLGIKLDQGVQVPRALVECGAEVVEWNPHIFASAIERAARATARTAALALVGSNVASSCTR